MEATVLLAFVITMEIYATEKLGGAIVQLRELMALIVIGISSSFISYLSRRIRAACVNPIYLLLNAFLR